MRNESLKRFTVSLAAGLVAWLALANTAVYAANEPDQLVSKAEATFRNFQNDPNMQWLRDNLPRAKAVLIAPEMRKAAFVVGGSGGRAVLLARDPNGEWSGPAFYTIANASLGLQAGVEKSEVVMLVMTDNGLTSLLKTQAKLGGDLSIAVGPVGSGFQRELTADIISFNRSRGIYGGLNLDGTLVKVSDERNHKYFGYKATPTDILIRHSVVNPGAENLKEQVARAAQ